MTKIIVTDYIPISDEKFDELTWRLRGIKLSNKQADTLRLYASLGTMSMPPELRREEDK